MEVTIRRQAGVCCGLLSYVLFIKGYALKSILASHSVKMCPLELSQKFPMTFGLGTVPRGEDRKWVDISLVLPVENLFLSQSRYIH